MLFLPPNQQRQITEGTVWVTAHIIWHDTAHWTSCEIRQLKASCFQPFRHGFRTLPTLLFQDPYTISRLSEPPKIKRRFQELFSSQSPVATGQHSQAEFKQAVWGIKGRNNAMISSVAGHRVQRSGLPSHNYSNLLDQVVELPWLRGSWWKMHSMFCTLDKNSQLNPGNADLHYALYAAVGL